MADQKRPEGAGETVLDVNRAPRRPQEGLVPDDTGIYVRFEKGPRQGQTITLSSGGVYVIGREGSDIALDDGKVSRKHAELGLFGPEAYVLRDLASTNGTWLNGRRIAEKAKLKHWDLILIGDTELRFALVDGSIPVS